MNNAATTVVNFVRKVPTDLADVKLSCETPKPNAPPSDLCKRIEMIKITARIILTKLVSFPLCLSIVIFYYINKFF